MNCDEVQFSQWQVLEFAVMEVSEDTTASLQKLLTKVYRDSESLKKKVRLSLPSVAVKPEETCTIRLPHTVLQQDPGAELTSLQHLVSVKTQEMRVLADQNIKMTDEIVSLKKQIEQMENEVRTRQLYWLKLRASSPSQP